MHREYFFWGAFVVSQLVTFSIASGQFRVQTLENPAAGGPFTGWGEVIRIDGDTLIIGSTGGAHAYCRSPQDEWIFEAVLRNPAESMPDIAVSGDTVAICNRNIGIRVYTRDSHCWTLQETLPLQDLGHSSVGRQIGLDGDILVVSSTNSTPDFSFPSNVYIYERDGGSWGDPVAMEPPNPGGDSFGYSVAIGGGTLVVGAPNVDYSLDSGKIFTFEKVGDSWIEGMSFDRTSGLRAHSLVFDGTTIAFCASEASEFNTYTHRADGWYAASQRGCHLEPPLYFPELTGKIDVSDDRLALSDGLRRIGTREYPQLCLYQRDGEDWQIVSDPPEYQPVSGLAIDGDWLAIATGFQTGDSVHRVVYMNEWIDSGVEEHQMLYPANGAANSRFGRKVAMSETFALISSSEITSIEKQGRVRAYEKIDGSWMPHRDLLPELQPADFGTSLAVSDRIALVGSLSEESVFVFEYSDSDWIHIDTIETPIPGIQFGMDVAIDGETLIVGAPRYIGPRGETGGAYIYQQGKNGLIQTELLLPSDGTSADRFGEAVDIKGHIAIVGARNHNPTAVSAGAAYVYTLSNGELNESKLLPNTEHAYLGFGTDVAISDHAFAVGCPLEEGPDGRGAVYVYPIEGDSVQAGERLTPVDASDFFGFGEVLGFAGKQLVVPSTSIYRFHQDDAGWTQLRTINLPEQNEFGLSPKSFAATNSVFVIGVPDANAPEPDSGIAYIYELVPGDGWVGY